MLTGKLQHRLQATRTHKPEQHHGSLGRSAVSSLDPEHALDDAAEQRVMPRTDFRELALKLHERPTCDFPHFECPCV
jgi:hypothetical protein